VCFKYDPETQAQIVYMLAVVHNFIKIHDPDNPSFKDNDIVFGSDGDNSITTWSVRVKGSMQELQHIGRQLHMQCGRTISPRGLTHRYETVYFMTL
jgi:hypothetical protein